MAYQNFMGRTMKAIILKENGGPENLKVAEIPVPEIKSNEVLVRVKAISINPVDAAVRQNSHALQRIIHPEKNEDTFILGWDISGTVEEAGSDVKTMKTGDDVFGLVNFSGNGKAYAEHIAARADHLALKPGNISHEEAAGATLAALTAWQGLVKVAKIKGGEKVLIHAAAGGVGHYAVQIAKYFGAYIIGTASSENRDFLHQLGADEIIDYTTTAFETKINDADIVLDSIGGDHYLRSIDALKPCGRLVMLKSGVGDGVEEKAEKRSIVLLQFLVKSSGEDMKHIAQLLEEGEIHSHISRTYHFDEIPQAHQQIETRKTRGKIVVVV